MSNELETIYVWNADLDYCKANVDLNEAEQCDIYLYPHKDTLKNLTKFVNVKAFDELKKQCDLLKDALDIEIKGNCDRKCSDYSDKFICSGDSCAFTEKAIESHTKYLEGNK